jgi:hypothetical protein
MKKFFLSGVVHPERAMLSVSNVEHGFQGPDGNAQGQIKFNIYNNQISAFVKWENDAEDILTLRNIVRASVEVITNVMGFLKGYAYDVEITKIFDSDLGLSVVFGIEIPALEERNKKRDFSGVGDVYLLCFEKEGVFLRRCLGDLSMAIKNADDTPFYCFRALESLKQYFGFKNGLEKDREQWEAMAKVIGVKQEVVEPIRKLAFPARHGVPDPITGEKRKQIFLTTWDIVERFIDYRLKEQGSNYRLQAVGE